MKVLIDESIQQGVADLLVQKGHDALHVVAIGLGGGSDDRVLAAAKRDGRILVTADSDFGDLLALSGESQPSRWRSLGKRSIGRCGATQGSNS